MSMIIRAIGRIVRGHPFLTVIAVLYTIQLTIVCSRRLSVIEERELDGETFVIRRGYGNTMDFVPVLGVIDSVDDIVNVTILDQENGGRETEWYDSLLDAKLANVEVWPDAPD